MAELQLSTLIKIILILLFIISGFVIYYAISLTANQQSQDQLCKVSVGFSQAIKKASSKVTVGVAPMDFIDLRCAREVIVVDESTKRLSVNYFKKLGAATYYDYLIRQEINSKERLVSKKIDTSNLQETLTEAISYEMVSCFDALGGGKVQVIDPDNWFVDETLCLICSEFIIETKTSPFNINLQEHLQKTKTHLLDVKSSAYNYLYSETKKSHPSECIKQFYPLNLEVIQGESYLVTAFMRGDEVGENDDCLAVGVIPSSELINYCDGVIN